MITCMIEHLTLNLRFTTVMRNTLRRGRKILNPRPTLISKSWVRDSAPHLTPKLKEKIEDERSDISDWLAKKQKLH